MRKRRIVVVDRTEQRWAHKQRWVLRRRLTDDIGDFMYHNHEKYSKGTVVYMARTTTYKEAPKIATGRVYRLFPKERALRCVENN